MALRWALVRHVAVAVSLLAACQWPLSGGQSVPDMPTTCPDNGLPDSLMCVCLESSDGARLALECRQQGTRLTTWPASLGDNVTDLTTNGVEFSHIPGSAFLSSASSLQSISIQYNQDLTTISTTAFTGLTSLTKLEISSCGNVSYFDENLFDPLVNLIELDLHSNNIKAIGQCQFQRLSKLEKINLGSNKIQDLSPGTFANLHQLTNVELDSNLLTSLVPETFFLLPNTTIAKLHLNLIGNPFTCDCRALWLHWLIVDDVNRSPILQTPICSGPAAVVNEDVGAIMPLMKLCSYRTPRILHRPGSVTRGQTTSMTCASLISSRRPLYYWYKDGIYQNPKTINPRYHRFYGVLTIENVTDGDAGEWLCYVTDPELDRAGFTRSTPYQLAVSDQSFCGHPVPQTSSGSLAGQWVGVGLGIFALVVVAIFAVYCFAKRMDDVVSVRSEGRDRRRHISRERPMSQQGLVPGAATNDAQTFGLAENPEYLNYLKHTSRNTSQSSGIGSLSYQRTDGHTSSFSPGPLSPSGMSSKSINSAAARFMEAPSFGVPRVVENPLIAMGYTQSDFDGEEERDSLATTALNRSMAPSEHDSEYSGVADGVVLSNLAQEAHDEMDEDDEKKVSLDVFSEIGAGLGEDEI